MPTPAIKERLVKQLMSAGKTKASAFAIAQSSLRKAGNVTASGKATAKGKKRGAMTPGQRSNDRAAKAGGGKPSDYRYKKATNSSVKKRKR